MNKILKGVTGTVLALTGLAGMTLGTVRYKEKLRETENIPQLTQFYDTERTANKFAYNITPVVQKPEWDKGMQDLARYHALANDPSLKPYFEQREQLRADAEREKTFAAVSMAPLCFSALLLFPFLTTSSSSTTSCSRNKK